MSIKLTSIAAGVLALASFTAPAQTLYGGGATLPAGAYVGGAYYLPANPTASPRISLVDNVKGGSYEGTVFGETAQRGFGAGKFTNVSYCQSGSGTGRNVILGGNAAGAAVDATGACPTFAGTAVGFGAPMIDPDFAASDAPLSDVEFARGVSLQPEHKQVVQFPVIAAAIAIAFNNAAVTTTLNLSTSQVCGIFNGSINNWSQLNFPAKPIKVVYRTDGSGTTFSFTNWLSANCPASSGYSTQSTFSAAITLPAGAIGASGNPGVANALAAAVNDGAIGYTEVADTNLRAPTVQIANVNGRSPTALVAPTVVLLKDSVLGPNVNGRPTIVALATPPVKGCVLLADPTSYATPNPATNYPIVGVSYLLAYNTANRLPTAVSRLVAGPYNGAIKGASKEVGAGTGYAFLKGNQTSTINKCIN